MQKKNKAILSEADVAYQILRQRKEPLHYRELITATLENMGQDSAISGTRLAQIHTEINLDNRFDFLGKGMWGLQIWAAKPITRDDADELNERRYQPKASDYIWDEDELEDDEDDEEGCLIADEDIDDEDEEEDETDTEDDIPLGDLYNDDLDDDIDDELDEDLEDFDEDLGDLEPEDPEN